MSTTLPTSTSSSTSASASSAYFKCRWVGCTYGVFPSELEVYHHVKRIHRNEGSGGQECDWVGNMDQRCGLLLRHKHHFVDHLSSHFSPSLKPFTCEVQSIFLISRAKGGRE